MEGLNQIPNIQILTKTVIRDYPLDFFILIGVLIFLIFLVIVLVSYLKKIVKCVILILLAIGLFIGEGYLYKNVLNTATYTYEILVEDHIDLEELSQYCDKIVIEDKKAIISWSGKIE